MKLDKVVAFDLSTEGLNPMQDRIIGITVKTATEERIFAERDEKVMLKQFWDYIKQKEFSRFVTFNGWRFDWKMLLLRSIKHRVKMVDIRESHVDLREVVFGSNLDERKIKGKLCDFQDLLGINFVNNGYEKMHMSLLWDDKARQLRGLNEFLLRDVKVTWKLYEYVKEAGLI